MSTSLLPEVVPEIDANLGEGESGHVCFVAVVEL